LVQTPKETGSKLLNKINWKIRQIKTAANFLHKKIVKLRCGEEIVFLIVLKLFVD